MLTLITLALTAVLTCAVIDAFLKIKEWFMALFDDLSAGIAGLVELASGKFSDVATKLDAIHAKVDALQKAVAAGSPITEEQVASLLASIESAKSSVSGASDAVSAKADEIIADEEA